MGDALGRLLAARDVAESEAAYWQLENHVVAQGTVYDSAVPCMRVLAAALVEPRPTYVRIAIYNLMTQILWGEPAPGAASGLIDECRAAVREALWCLVHEYANGYREAAWDVLAELELGDRLDAIRAAID